MGVRTLLGVSRAEEGYSGFGEMIACNFSSAAGRDAAQGPGDLVRGSWKKDVDRDDRAAAGLLLRNLLED